MDGAGSRGDARFSDPAANTRRDGSAGGEREREKKIKNQSSSRNGNKKRLSVKRYVYRGIVIIRVRIPRSVR